MHPHRTAAFTALWESLLPLGRDATTGGYRRFAWTDADHACREWFTHQADARGMALDRDRNGNLWAWWGTPAADAVVTGSHLDSVPDGGAYDGPLGIVSAFAAVDLLQERGFTPRRPIAVAVFADEEGARFGVACVGSRLLTGSLTPGRALALTDDEGTTLAEALTGAGLAPGGVGRDTDTLSRIGVFVELHVEQGRSLVDHDAAVGVATSIWPHSRWRLDLLGQGNHAGTTLVEDRRDPMVPFAEAVLAARTCAREAGARATVGKVHVQPNGTNAIPSSVTGWLDARARNDAGLRGLVSSVRAAVTAAAEREGVRAQWTQESLAHGITFDPGLRDRISATLGGVPLLPTAAGHDAGVLAAAGVPTAMLFVRNPTGVSHSPAEHAEQPDCVAGTAALAAVLEDLAG